MTDTIYMTNKKLAVKPFETVETKVTTHHALAYIRQKAELYEQEVVYGSSDGEYRAGDRVLLHGDCCKHPYAKAIYRLGDADQDFVVVPYEMILGVVRKTPERPQPTRIPGPGVERENG